MDFKKIFNAYDSELRRVENSLNDLFKSNVFIIPLIGKHLIGSGGKRLRPLFLLLSARLSGYKGDAHIALAGIIESIHTASLLHDDVVDGAELRRGKPVAHSIWGNQAVILVGDFLYSNALKRAVAFKNQDIMEALSEATTRMTEGELLQLNRAGDPDITEEEYIEIISSKTGALISAACRIGGILGNVNADREDALARFGMKAGIAFQMADDILDYMAEESELGKRLGKDLGEGKITLSLIHLLKTATRSEKEEIKDIIKNGFSKERLSRILTLFRKYRAIEESFKKAKDLVDEAKAELLIFPSSPERDALLDIADYALSREK